MKNGFLIFKVSRYLDAPEIITGHSIPMNPMVKQRLLRHLDSCVSELDLDLGSRPDSGLGSSPGSVTTDRVTGAVSPGALEATTSHCNTSQNATSLIKTELVENIRDNSITRSDNPAMDGDENNNSRPTSAFNHTSVPGFEQPQQQNAINAHFGLMGPLGISIGVGLSAPCDQASTSQQQQLQPQGANMLSVVQVLNTCILLQ